MHYQWIYRLNSMVISNNLPKDSEQVNGRVVQGAQISVFSHWPTLSIENSCISKRGGAVTGLKHAVSLEKMVKPPLVCTIPWKMTAFRFPQAASLTCASIPMNCMVIFCKHNFLLPELYSYSSALTQGLENSFLCWQI